MEELSRLILPEYFEGKKGNKPFSLRSDLLMNPVSVGSSLNKNQEPEWGKIAEKVNTASQEHGADAEHSLLVQCPAGEARHQPRRGCRRTVLPFWQLSVLAKLLLVKGVCSCEALRDTTLYLPPDSSISAAHAGVAQAQRWVQLQVSPFLHSPAGKHPF